MGSKKVKLISVFCSAAPEDEVVRKLRSVISDNEIGNRTQVLRYLEGGLGWKKIWKLTYDVLSPERECIGSLEVFTDGVWAWSREIIYYFKHYNLLLPPAFLEHMSRQKWI